MVTNPSRLNTCSISCRKTNQKLFTRSNRTDNAITGASFNQKVAPSMKTILTNTDGVFADLFKQYAAPANNTEPKKTVTGVQP